MVRHISCQETPLGNAVDSSTKGDYKEGTSCLCHRRFDVQSFSRFEDISEPKKCGHDVGEEVVVENKDTKQCEHDDDGYYKSDTTFVEVAVMKNGIWRFYLLSFFRNLITCT